MTRSLALDDLYGMVAHIYSEQNVARTTAAGFAAFVESCGMLTIHESRKTREELTVTDALCKALASYIALLIKMKIKSIEEILYRKFPYACPYCLLTPHSNAACKKAGDLQTGVNNDGLQTLYLQNRLRRPRGLDEWQTMFQEIYPRSPQDRRRSLLGLFEELGELAEAIRVFGKDPKYFVGEAADTFSYIMGLANEHKAGLALDGIEFSFEAEFLKRYPGLCIECGCCVCVCPAVPRATVGRPAKEIDIGPHEALFFDVPFVITERGQQIAYDVRSLALATSELASRLPIQRGQVNNAFIIVSLLLAEAVKDRFPSSAACLTSQAIAVGTMAMRGDESPQSDLNMLLDTLADTWQHLSNVERERLRRSGGLIAEICDTVDRRVRRRDVTTARQPDVSSNISS